MKADLALALHFHQPVGNFDSVMERACDNCYIPFLETVKKYPEIKMNFHFTGCLLEWAEQNRTEIIELVREMVKTSQVEIISGGFYEPILPVIPQKDRIKQIKLLNDYIVEKFRFKPQGAWIAERVWEPFLPSALKDSGIKYVILDDTHFLYSGISKDKTYGYYTTEDNAKQIAVFPSDKVLRYNLPFRMPEETINYMKSVASANVSPLFVYGDDGEKFGEWPGTHKWVFQEKWLENFLDEITKNSDWLNTVKLSEVLKSRVPEGRVYLPAVSYEEMCEWALPADTQIWMESVKADIQALGKQDFYKPFIRAGFWRNFLSKYPESNHMHKKMIYVSRKLEKESGSKNKKNVVSQAEKELFRGQCNCAYWHGVFGGLYLFKLRDAVYRHLIKSESLMDEGSYGKKDFLSVQILDFNGDGFDEIIVENRKMSVYFSPAEGGILKELDSKEICCNLINSLSRKKEAYHKKILEDADQRADNIENEPKTIHDSGRKFEENAVQHLNYDRTGRYSLVDHFFSSDVNIDMFSDEKYEETGDFLNAEYDSEIKNTSDKVLVVLKRNGKVSGNEICVTKEITILKNKSECLIKYAIVNKSNNFVSSVFAPEFNLTMPEADADKYFFDIKGSKKIFSFKEKIVCPGASRVTAGDTASKLGFEFNFNKKCGLWIFPLKTVSQSEKAYELNYQSSVIVPQIELELNPSEKKEIIIILKIFV
ncbi:MAG: alpha-amylase/4-alpha-glucanotransferase domain-containing protein [Candidatus Omnitrophota bacterium]